MLVLFVLIFFSVGLFCIVKGGDFLVTSAIKIGRLTSLSHMFIGATFVTIATSIPEVIVSVIAVVNGSYGIAVGNIIGGLTANIALVLAISMIFLPSSNTSKKEAITKSLFMICAFVLVFFFSLNLRITWIEGLSLILFFLCFIIFSIFRRKKRHTQAQYTFATIQEFVTEQSGVQKQSLSRQERKMLWSEIAVGFFLGQILIVFGAFVLVSNAERLASIMGISETVIGLTFMAFGASAPELTTVVASIRKKSGDMALGNILGSNIINSTLLLGLLVMTSYAIQGPLPIARITMAVSIPLLIGVSLIAVLPMILKGKSYRWQGIVLIATYVIYIAALALFGSG